MKYTVVEYQIRYIEPVVWNRTPSFIFRSVIGLNLHRLTCILKNQEGCASCCLNKTCAYSFFFETHIDKNTSILQGREKAPHPFVLNYKAKDERQGILTVTFLGIGCNYVPYVTESLLRGEKYGIGKNRAPYEVERISSGGNSLNDSGCVIKQWPEEDFNLNGDFLIKMETPCRVQREGKLCHELDLSQLVSAIYGRMKILEGFYGDGMAELPMPDSAQVPESEIVRERWINKPYYSVRQQELLKLGGLIGEIKVKGPVDKTIGQYIDALRHFNVGKNISFGLGKISIEEFA